MVDKPQKKKNRREEKTYTLTELKEIGKLWNKVKEAVEDEEG